MKVKLSELIIDSMNTIDKKDFDKDFLDNLLVWISFFQHERFVHLLVTVFVGICSILFLLSSLYFGNLPLLLLFIITFALFVPYIFHYYNLENGVQKLYDIYNEGYIKLNKNNKKND